MSSAYVVQVIRHKLAAMIGRTESIQAQIESVRHIVYTRQFRVRDSAEVAQLNTTFQIAYQMNQGVSEKALAGPIALLKVSAYIHDNTVIISIILFGCAYSAMSHKRLNARRTWNSALGKRLKF